jgi:glycerol-3-phosphate acyltransferase PlsY
MVIWIAIAIGFRVSSLAALVAAALMPLGGFYFFGNSLIAWSLVPIVALLFWRHRANIRQLMDGREKPIGR